MDCKCDSESCDMKTLTFEIYKDKKEFRWRLKIPEGEIIAECVNGYKQKKDIIRLIEDIQYDQIFFTYIDTTTESYFNESFVMREHYDGQIIRSK